METLKYKVRHEDHKCLTNCNHIPGDVHIGSLFCKQECEHNKGFTGSTVKCDYKNPDFKRYNNE